MAQKKLVLGPRAKNPQDICAVYLITKTIFLSGKTRLSLTQNFILKFLFLYVYNTFMKPQFTH